MPTSRFRMESKAAPKAASKTANAGGAGADAVAAGVIAAVATAWNSGRRTDSTRADQSNRQTRRSAIPTGR